MQKNASDKTQHLFMIKTLSKLGIERNFFNPIRNTYKTPTVNIILKGKKLEMLSPRSGTRQGCPHSPLLHHTASLG